MASLKWYLFVFVGIMSSMAWVTFAQDDPNFDEDMIEDDDFEIVDKEEPELKLPEERPVYKRPNLSGNAFFVDPFDSESEFVSRWIKSAAKKDDTDEDIGKYDGQWNLEEPEENPIQDDMGLVLKSRAKHHAITAMLDKPVKFSGKPFVVQYEVKFQNGQDCGGAYIKLLSEDKGFDQSKFTDKTPYTIMFGPDKCGNDHKLHFIFRHQNPVTKLFEEKHAKKPTASIDNVFSDKKTHLFTLVVNPDNSFEIYVDQDMVNSGSLLEDVEPPVNPPKQIVDPNDHKPKDWDDREKIPDPDAVKPDDWDEDEPEMIPDDSASMPEGWLVDEPELLPDPEAEKPSDWDDDMDGEWEAPQINNPVCDDAPGCGEWVRPMIKNPLYKGKWRAPKIDNPEYKGKWTAKMIDNPDYFEDKEPYKMTPINAVGLELWSMSSDIYFDNFIITDDRSVADKWAVDTWEIKHMQEQAASIGGKSVVQAVMDATNERPWLWAVFIVVVVLPIILVIAYCCMPSSKTDEAAERKKTDAPSPDDAAEDGEEEANESAKTKSGKKASKSSLDAAQKEDSEQDEEKEDEPQKRQSPRKRREKPPKE